jgi:hypothetical protein
MNLEPVHWAIFLALLAAPVAGCVLLNWHAVRSAQRPPRASTHDMPVARKFLTGYLPYTAVPVVGLVVLAVAASGPMGAAAALVALLLAALFALLQLAILGLRPRPGDRFGFQAGCVLVTMANLVLVPGLLAGVGWFLH